MFTQELEESLLRGETHLAVHSAKDVQSSIPRELELLAFLEREQVNDVVLSFNESFSLDKPGIVLGTSSTRRKAQLRRFYPHATTAEARGNLQTRLRKLEEGQFDALVLAYAGVHRMGYEHLVRHTLPGPSVCARHRPGQHRHRVRRRPGRGPESPPQSGPRPPRYPHLPAGRARLSAHHGRRVQHSVFCPGHAGTTASVRLHGGLISLSGEEYVEEIQTVATAAEAHALGVSVADAVLGRGGREILASIREHRG